MWNRRALLAIFSGLALAAAAFALWRTRMLWLPLPDPRVADHVGLVRWIVLRDLAAEPADVRLELVSRVEELLDEPPAVEAVSADAVGAVQSERTRKNVELLKELWFDRAVERFHELEPARRWAYLDRQIERIARWMHLDDRLAPQAAATGGGSWGGFFASIDRWAANATEARQNRIWAAVKAGLIRWLGTTDVARQTDDARTSLALEIEKQLTGPLELSDATDGFSNREQSRFWRNVERLAEAWFRYQSRRHAAAIPREQARQVERHLRLIEQFAPYFDRLPTTGAPPGPQAAGFVARVENWIAQAPPTDQPAMRQLSRHLAGAILLQKMKSLWRQTD
jgi:hypothetical protein